MDLPRRFALAAVALAVACKSPKIDDDGGGGGGGDDTADDCAPTGEVEDCDTPEDDDCSGSTNDEGADGCEDWYPDRDGDGYGEEGGSPRCLCEGEGDHQSKYPSDCNDESADAYLGYTEVCDGIDNDCDGEADERDADDATWWYLDADGDGYGGYDSEKGCEAPEGYVAEGDDCEDEDPLVNPGMAEVCDGIDNDCDLGTEDEGRVTAYADASLEEALNTWTSLASALAGAPADAVLVVCPGTYVEDVTIGQNVTIQALEGSFTTTVQGTGTRPVVTVRSGDVVLQGLTVEGGEAIAYGGGIDAWAHEGSLVVDFCHLWKNSGVAGAGAALGSSGGWTLRGTTIEENLASGGGGGST